MAFFLQVSTTVPSCSRPPIPSCEELTESLMAAAAERKRKKSVSQSIRLIASSDKAR